jgi:hypothetical protein
MTTEQSGPPPKSPGPGLRWVRYEDLVERQIKNALMLWEHMIKAEPNPSFQRALERRRLENQTEIAAYVRMYYAMRYDHGRKL